MDVNGRFVGDVVGLPGECDARGGCDKAFIRVARRLGLSALAYFVDENGFVDVSRLKEDFSVGAPPSNFGPRIWTEAADCTGEMLLTVDPSQAMLPLVRVSTIQGYAPFGPSAVRAVNGYREVLGGTCMGGTSFTALTAPGGAIDLTRPDFRLIPPFHVEAP